MISGAGRAAKALASPVAAGALIAVAGIAYLSCDNRYVGAMLFPFGLFAVTSFGLKLFTGMAGYLFAPPSKGGVRPARLALAWLGNLIGAVLTGILINFAKPGVAASSALLGANKLAQPMWATFILSVFCGAVMFVAVDLYKRLSGVSRYLGVFTGVPVFILCGFEHSVADMFYLTSAVCDLASFGRAALFIIIASTGNAAGAILLRLMTSGGASAGQKADKEKRTAESGAEVSQ